MKKLQFIIPICNLLYLLFYCQLAKADEHRYGCWLTDTNHIWYTLDPSRPGSTSFLTDGITGALNGIDDGYYDRDSRCPAISVPCEVYWQVSAIHPTGDLRGQGILADFSIDYCPFDQQYLLFMLVIGCYCLWKDRLALG